MRAATEAANGKIDDATRRLSADFEAAAAVPTPWEIDEYTEYTEIYGELGDDS